MAAAVCSLVAHVGFVRRGGSLGPPAREHVSSCDLSLRLEVIVNSECPLGRHFFLIARAEESFVGHGQVRLP